MSSKSYFNQVANRWDDMGNSFFGDAPRNKIISTLQIDPQMSVIDLGCGTGYLLEAFRDHEGLLFAFDQSQEMLDRVVAKGLVSAKHTLSNIDDLAPNSMDIAVANMFFHHLESPAGFIKKVYRLLRSGGQLVFADIDSHDHEFLVVEQHDIWMGFDRDLIRQWLADAGFTDIHIDCVGSDCCADSCRGDERVSISIFCASAHKA